MESLFSGADRAVRAWARRFFLFQGVFINLHGRRLRWVNAPTHPRNRRWTVAGYTPGISPTARSLPFHRPPSSGCTFRAGLVPISPRLFRNHTLPISRNFRAEGHPSSVVDNFHDTTARARQSITATKYANPTGIGIEVMSAHHTSSASMTTIPFRRYGYCLALGSGMLVRGSL
jgi:hypothetical protein